MTRPVQLRNSARFDLAGADAFQHGFQYLHEPLGDIAVWNGQFETGPGSGSPPGWPEGWELYTYTGGSVSRVTGGFAGNYRMRGGQAGTGRGGYIVSLRYISVSEDDDYYIAAAFTATSVNGTVYLGCYCYDATKAYLGNAWAVSAATPGTSWVLYERRIGPTGDVAWQANTRYCRVVAILQYDNTLTNNYCYVDDIQFGQQKVTTSPKIHLVDDYVQESTETFTDDTAFALWANSTMTITLTEQGYLWYSWIWYTYCNAARATASLWRVYVDGVGDVATIQTGSAGVNYRVPMCITARSSSILSAATHTLDMRCQIGNAGDTVIGVNLQGQVYYTRAY